MVASTGSTTRGRLTTASPATPCTLYFKIKQAPPQPPKNTHTHTHTHTHHFRLQNQVTEEYLCHLPHPSAHYCFSSNPMYFSFQYQNPPQHTHTHTHTYHVRLHNKVNGEYLCHLPHPSLATVAILFLLALYQSLRHAPEQVFQIGVFLSRLDITIGGQQLRDSLFELEGGDDFVILQILEFPNGQIFP